MLAEALHRAYGPMVYAYTTASINRKGRLPVPRDPPIAHASGPDADRVLIIGGLAVRGLGVASYQLGLAGRLARALAARTGRGADVEAMGFGHFDSARVADELRRIDLGRFDAIVVQAGGWELLSLRPVRAWARDIARVLAAVAEGAPIGTPVLMLGVTPVDVGAPSVHRVFAKHARRMNAVTIAACAQSRVGRFVPLPAATTLEKHGPADSRVPTDYARWAEDIAPALASALCEAAPREIESADEAERQRALDDLHLTRDPDIRLERIVRMARVVFGTTAAALTIIDGDRQWMKTVIGDMTPDDLPRDEAACSITVDTRGAFIVEDLALDPATASMRWVRGPDGKRFYAGFPLEAPGGQRIGALCVLDAAPRTFSSDEVSLLRDLALRAQAVLWDPPDPSVA